MLLASKGRRYSYSFLILFDLNTDSFFLRISSSPSFENEERDELQQQ